MTTNSHPYGPWYRDGDRLTQAAPALYTAAKEVVLECEAGFKKFGMAGPDPAIMGIVWDHAYTILKEAVDAAEEEAGI